MRTQTLFVFEYSAILVRPRARIMRARGCIDKKGKKTQKILEKLKPFIFFAVYISEGTKIRNTMKTKMPLYLVEFGMDFKFKKSVYTLVGRSSNGMFEARDKFGLIVEFLPNIAVFV